MKGGGEGEGGEEVDPGWKEGGGEVSVQSHGRYQPVAAQKRERCGWVGRK